MAYTKGSIVKCTDADGDGYNIEILDPDGDVIAELHVPCKELNEGYEASLHARADTLISHLNR